MLPMAHFVQECPVCGRPLEVRVEYLGRQVTCRHCRGTFKTVVPTEGPDAPTVEGIPLLRRANLLLEMAHERLCQY